MTRTSWDRLAAATGIGFAIAFVGAFLIAGSFPKLDDSASEAVSFYGDHRTRILVAAVVFGLAVILFLWFIGSLASELREAGEQRLAAVTFGAGVTLTAMVTGVIAMLAGLAFSIAGTADASVVKALSDLQFPVGVMISYPALVFVESTGIAILRTGLLPRWLGWTSMAAGTVFLAGGTTWARDGFWAPDGAYNSVITSLLFAVWTLVTSALLAQKIGAEERRHMAAPMPA